MSRGKSPVDGTTRVLRKEAKKENLGLTGGVKLAIGKNQFRVWTFERGEVCFL